jgi:methylmalonyl-CoA mutase C-terminal domain/subunit
VAKPGLDGHDRGAKVMVRALRDAALQEDVDVVGLSILSGAHIALFPRIMDALALRGLDDVLVVAGGTIPEEDIPAVRAMGIAAVFGPGTSLAEAVGFLRDHAPARRDEV